MNRNVMYPHGQCEVCGWGRDRYYECVNGDCPECAWFLDTIPEDEDYCELHDAPHLLGGFTCQLKSEEAWAGTT